MSDTGKQSPLGVNALTSLLADRGLCINPPTALLTGKSHSYSKYTFASGSVVRDTCLRLLTFAIRDAWVFRSTKVTGATYKNLIAIGSTMANGAKPIAALGNSKADSFTWTGWPKWCPYGVANPYANELTSWGYIRLFALQAWNEFNYNSSLAEFKDFLLYFSTAYSFIEYSNAAILAVDNSKAFLNGMFSNMHDLISADITGVSLSLPAFGQDLINLGRALDLSTIDTFGLPSNLLLNLKQTNALTDAINLAILSNGISTSELADILNKVSRASKSQEIKLYNSFKIIVGKDLAEVTLALNCSTPLTSLADLLDPAKLFPVSGISLTVPVYNIGGTNSKTYYNIYTANLTLNSLINNSTIKAQIGTKILAGTPEISAGVSTAIQVYNPPTGFGSYLEGILPTDIAVAAGAFGTSMGHIRNIKNVPIVQFANVVNSIETAKDLGVTGTNIPTNMTTVATSLPKIAKGSGPQGTFTMSDFLGCMSGLPYKWARIKALILQLQTLRLIKIYKALYLAVTWEGAKAAVTHVRERRQIRWWVQGYLEQEAVPGVPVAPAVTGPPWTVEPIPFKAARAEVTAQYEYFWRVSGITITNPGGGYGRGDTAPIPVPSPSGPAPAPKILITDNGTRVRARAECRIGTNDQNVPGDFGRVNSIWITDFGEWVKYATLESVHVPDLEWSSSVVNPAPAAPAIPVVPNPPYARMQRPPITLPGGVNPGGVNPGDDFEHQWEVQGWTGIMNPIVSTYINQANTEIVSIFDLANKDSVLELNRLWYDTGVQLSIEQESISIGIPLPVPL